MCGFCNVWVCAWVGFVMCGCVHVWVCVCVGVLVICVPVFTVVFILFRLCIFILLSTLTEVSPCFFLSCKANARA